MLGEGEIFMVKEKPPQIELVIPMLPNMELAATKTAQAVADYMELGEEQTAEVTMALIEACINAFEHGKSKENNIHIRFILREDALVIEIKDKGQGFDISQVEMPEIAKKLHSERKRGWGLQLMRELMDEVEIDSTQEGTLITMIKKR
jgi:serine/threonine-protein kinase RsbW